MILALLLTAASGPTALDAERAFAAAAQVKGQWTAFREYAAPDATMFVPQPVKAQTWLQDRKDPARSVRWSAAASYVSCDGTMAANTGPWRHPDRSVGYFSTLWLRQPDAQWKWIADAGDALPAERSQLNSTPTVRHASCDVKPTSPPEIAFRCAPQASRRGKSDDGTLAYFWYVMCGGGSRSLLVWMWIGSGWEQVIADHVVLKHSK